MKHFINDLRENKGLYLLLVGIVVLALAVSAGMIFYGRYSLELRYENNLNYGYASMDAGDYEDAVAAFELAYLTQATDEAAIGLAKAWHAQGNTEKAIQVVTSRMGLYAPTEELNALLEEYKKAIGYYSTVVIGGKTITKTDTAIFLQDVTLTDADKQALAEFPELVTVSLINCGLTDIAFLQNHDKLMSVTLTGNPITDFSPLHNKAELRTLCIDSTAITDFTQLHSMTTLTTLSMNNVWITTEERGTLFWYLPTCKVIVSPDRLIETLTLGGVTFRSDVTELNLSGLGLTDTTILKKCTRLEKLDLSGNKIGWITGLGEIPTLTHLNLSGNKLSNISALNTLTNLTYLNLTNNTVTDLSPTASMTKLTELLVSGNPIYHGHEKLAALVNLQTLDLSDTLLQDKHLPYIPMDHMTHLDLRSNSALKADTVTAFVSAHNRCTVLNDFVTGDVTLGSKTFPADSTAVDASYSAVIDISPASAFTLLTDMNLSGNGISDFAPLKQMTALTTLNLSATGMTDAAPLSVLTQLQKLDLSGNSLKDVYSLASCTALTELRLTNNAAIADISPLTYCKQLTVLHLDGTAVSDVSPLTQLSQLQTLVLDRCPVSDFTRLHTMVGLKSLYIIDCGITPVALYDLQQALPQCTIYPGDVAAEQPTPSPEAADSETTTP